MEQVFFRLHVRFVSTVTRLLSPKTRRVLEYVTLANAFVLVVSLTWLHARFVNPKGGQDSVVSCLPAALQRAGVDPAQLHVLQIHIRVPPDDERVDGDDGGSGSGGSGRRLPTVPSSADSSCSLALDGSSYHDAWHSSDGTGQGADRDATSPGARDSAGSSGSAGGGGGTSGAGAARSGRGDGSPSEPDSPPPEIFYGMKLVTGKDAVGTLSGPVTLGLDRFVGDGAMGSGDGLDAGGGNGGDGAACDALAEENRLTFMQWLVDAFSWRKGEAAVARRRSAAGAGHRAAGSLTPGGGLGSTPYTACAAIGDTTADVSTTGDQSTLNCHEYQRGWGMAAGQGDGGGRQRGRDEVYLYSLEKGFLMLRPDLRRKHGIVMANVTVSAHDPCLGGKVVQTLVKDFIGYDTVVMNWLISLYGGRGFLYGVHNNELFNLNYAAEFIESTEDIGKFLVFKIGVMFTTLFLFFTTTTLVSFTLRETQERMLKFTFLLQHHVRHRLPYAPLIFTHVVESLVFVPIMVGILFFLFEFFSDQLLAFMVLSVVWLCEVYSVVSVRTSICIRFFPQVFFLYFTLFHVYFFSFPFGFSYLALVTTVLFLQHSMLFCWNRYEVPALTAGIVSAARPRQAGMVIGVVPRYDPHGMVLPLMPQPGDAGVDAEVAAPARPRAATVSSLGEPREFTVMPPRPAARFIPRSNSSPNPASFSQPFGGSGRMGNTNNSGLDDIVAAAAAAAAATAAASASTTPAASILGGTEPTGRAPGGRLPAAEWPRARSWVGLGGGLGGGGGGGSDDEGNLDGLVGNSTSGGRASPPLLGSFPYSWNSWSGIQDSPSARRDQTSATARARAAMMRARTAPDGERGGSTTGTGGAFARADAEVQGGGGRAAALPASVNAQARTAAALTAAPASAAARALGASGGASPAGTTNPPKTSHDNAGEDRRVGLVCSQTSRTAAAAAAAAAQERAVGASRAGLLTTQMPLGSADGAGHLSGGEQPGGETEAPDEEPSSLRGEGEDSRRRLLSSGGTAQRRLAESDDDADADMAGRASAPTGSPEGR